MADDQQAQQSVETETQQEVMPTSQQQTTETEGVQEAADTSQETTSTTEETDSLPQGVKERTSEQFEKLRNQLAQEREQRLRLERTLTQTPQGQGQPEKPDWYNPDTGEVDVNKLSTIEAAREQRIAQLERQLQGSRQKEEQKQEIEAYQAYPELDPKSKEFDDKFQEQVVNTLAVAYARGENPTYKEAADSVVAIAERRLKKAEQQGAQKAMEQLSPKEQAALEATGRSDRRPQVDTEALKNATRQPGQAGIMAAMQRLSKIPTVGT